MSPLTSDQQREITDLARTNGKIYAVKRLRELTGQPLKTCKQQVEHWLGEAEAPIPKLATNHQLSDADLDRVLDEITAGNKIAAVKQYMELTNCSLRDSKELVEKLMAELEIEDKPGGCGPAVLLFLMLGAGLTALAL